MRWLITGDWQTKFNNLAEVKKAHEQELAIIKEYKIKGHIDLGDRKDDYSPVAIEVVEVQMARTKAILEVIDPKNSISLLGNHDRAGQHSDERNWLKLFAYLGGHIIESPDVILTKTLNIFGLPYTRNVRKFLKGSDTLAEKAKKLKGKKILIFHQEVKDARYSKLRGSLVSSKITVESLHADSYDQCFGGHIHLRQKLSENVRFVGNPFATDWGEIDQRKGFTVYDDGTGRVEFIESLVPGRYSYAYLQKNRIEQVPDGTQIKDTVVCTSVGSEYHKLLERRIREISKAYPNGIVQALPHFETDTGELEEASSRSTEAENLRLYIRASLPHTLRKRKKKAIAYLQSILDKALGRRVRATDKITFEGVEATNVLSFRHVKFDFRKRGTILITGDNRSGGVLESNGAGKTNFLSLPCVALEGKTFKGQTHDKWANSHTKGPAIITQNLRTSNGDRIRIIRNRRPGNLQLVRNKKDISHGKTQTQVQTQIEELTGYTYDTLSNSVYIDQTLSNVFISGTDSTRSALIARFQNLDKFELARELAAKDLRKIKLSIEELEYEIGLLKETLVEKKHDLKSHTRVVDKKKSRLKKQLREEEAIQKVQERSLVKRVIYWKKKLEDLDVKNSKLSIKDKDIGSQLYMTRSIIDGAKKNLERLQNLKIDKCPECLRPMDRFTRATMIAQAQKVKLKHEQKLQELLTMNEEHRKKSERLLAKVEKLQKAIHINTELTGQGNQRIRELKHKLQTLRELEKEDNKRVRAKHSISRIKSKIRACKDFLEDLSEQLEVIEFAIETFARKGFPAFLSKLVCPVLNKAAEYYSDLFLDGEIQVVFDIVKDAIKPKIINVNGDKEIVGQSQGEKAWAGIIASFALRDGIAQPSNLLILDEPGNGLDRSGAKRFGERIRKLEDRYDTILITTHNQHLAAALNDATSLCVIKTNKISRIQSKA